jgi:hypothetical protein
MKKFTLIIVLVLLANILVAEESCPIISSSSSFLLQVSTLPEAKLGFSHRIVLPFLQGESPLTSDNNLSLSLTGEVSPISLNGLFDAVVTPIAFIELSAGGRIGTGWPLELLGSDIYGTGLNTINGDKAEYSGSPFDGIVWKVQTGGTFQFDLAAIYPGDWNHVVFLTYHEINYSAYTRAKEHEAWYFEADDGENVNGFNYYGNFLIGYQMPRKPFFLNLVGFLAEMELYLYDTPGREIWGDDLIRWTFSNILSFDFTDQFGIAVITQFRTRRNFTNFDERTDDIYSVHYRNRILDTSNPLRLEFYRVAGAITYRF